MIVTPNQSFSAGQVQRAPSPPPNMEQIQMQLKSLANEKAISSFNVWLSKNEVISAHNVKNAAEIIVGDLYNYYYALLNNIVNPETTKS